MQLQSSVAHVNDHLPAVLGAKDSMNYIRLRFTQLGLQRCKWPSHGQRFVPKS